MADFRWNQTAAIVAGFGAGAIVLAVSISSLFEVSAQAIKPPTPPLLSGATASGGSWGSDDCPNEAAAMRQKSLETGSPTIGERLRADFPPGTDARRLAHSLVSQGFTLMGACALDRSIERAQFRQTGGGFLGPYPGYALIHWKVDSNGKIIWAKGWIAFTGP